MLRICLLGTPKLVSGGQSLKFQAPPKTLPLLAYLLLHRKEMVDRQQAAFTLWPDCDENSARANLRRHLHWLGRCLPPGKDEPWLIAGPSSLQWNPKSNYSLDVAEFEEYAGRSEDLEKAVDLYCGDLLEGFYDDWIFFDRERLRELYLSTLGKLVFRYRADGRFNDAIRCAQLLLARDPLREDAVRQLISVRYEAGDRAGAIAEYNRFSRLLAGEVGVPPMPETESLYRVILRQGRLPGEHTPAASPDSSEKLAATPSLLPFVGRETEMVSLSSLWTRAARSRGGCLVLIGGEAGVGKTRLMRELSLAVENQGGRILLGAVKPEEHSPYEAIVEMLRSSLPLMSSLADEPACLSVLSALLPELKEMISLPVLPVLRPDQDKQRLFASVAECLQRFSEPRPVFVILEDLHWARESTLELLEFIARSLCGQPVLIVGTYRENETPRKHPLRAVRRRLEKENAVEHIALRRISAQAVEDLLSRLPQFEGRYDLACTAKTLFEASDGNPLFIGFLLQILLERGEILDEDLPKDLMDMIDQRLGVLSSEARAYGEIASVLGPSFEAELVQEVGGWSESDAIDALSELLDSQFVRDKKSSSEFTFAHHLVQAALYQSIPAQKRKSRHLRAAEIMEDMAGEAVEELSGMLAFHFDRGGASLRAVPYYMKAAQVYQKTFAYEEALTAIQRALKLLDTLPEDSITLGHRFELLALREQIYDVRANRDEQWNDLEHMDLIARQLRDPQKELYVLRSKILFKRVTSDRQGEGQLVNLLKQRAQEETDITWKVESLESEGIYFKLMNDHKAAAERLEQALRLREQSGDIAGQVTCCCYLAETALLVWDYNQAFEWFRRAEAAGLESCRPTQVMRTLWTAAGASLANNDYPMCHSFVERLQEYARKAGDLNWQGVGHMLLGQAHTQQFHIVEAREHLAEALEIFHNIRKPIGVSLTLKSMGYLALTLGQYEQAIDHYQQALEMDRRLGDRQSQVICAINLGCAYELMESPQEELRYSLQALEQARELEHRYLEAASLGNLGEAEANLGHLEKAIRYTREAIRIYTEIGQTVKVILAESDLALMILAMGDIQTAFEMAEKLVASYPEVEEKTDDPQRVLRSAARIFHFCGLEEKAADAVERAYRTFQQQLSSIPDPESQEAYRALKFNREIAAAYELGLWT